MRSEWQESKRRERGGVVEGAGQLALTLSPQLTFSTALIQLKINSVYSHPNSKWTWTILLPLNSNDLRQTRSSQTGQPSTTTPSCLKLNSSKLQ